MGLIRSAMRASLGGTSGLATPERWVEDWITGGLPTLAGVRVDPDTAITWGPFFAGVRLLAQDVGSLPLHVYERLERGKRRATEHPLYRLLHDAPNPLMTAISFRETLQGHVLTWGSGYAYIVRDGRGQVVELWPLRPDRMCVDVRADSVSRVRVRYLYSDPVNNIQTVLLPDEVLHIAGLGYDGIRGYSLVSLARQSIGLGMATELYGASFFGNGSNPSGVLTHPRAISDEAKKRLKAGWESLHRGIDNAQRIAILEEGVTWQQIGVPPDDAQFLQTREFSVSEAARWLNVPPHKLQDLSRATYSNIEQQGIDYVTGSLRPWLVRWEQSISQRLLTDAERPRFFAEHLVDGLLRGDTPSRFQSYATARQWGWMSANDVRELENQNPVEGGDTYLVPLNMVPADQAGEPPEPVPPPADDEPAEDEGRSANRRSLTGRRRIARSFAPLIIETDTRLAKLEKAEVSSLVRKHIDESRGRTRSISAFTAALEILYEGLITDRSIAAWTPVLGALAEQISHEAADEVGHEDEVDLYTWVAAYVASHVAYRVASALGQLTKDTESDDPVAAVGDRLASWVADRPERLAKWETVQTASAAARETWKAAGVRELRWHTRGDNCPYCRDLDGKVVGIQEPFMAKGDEITDGDQKLVAKRNQYHPPIHPGCDCEVSPV